MTSPREEQRRPEFLALNPNGTVPTLVVDGTPMFEALAIMMWLGDRFGVERNLWPATDDAARLEAMAWSTWAYLTMGAAIQRLHFASSDRVPVELHSEALAKRSYEDLQEHLGILDARLASRRHLLGDDFSLADLIVASAVTYATYCGVPTEGQSRLQAWLARFHARPAYRKTWKAA